MLIDADALDQVRHRPSHPALVLQYAPPVRAFDAVLDYLVTHLPEANFSEVQFLDVLKVESRSACHGGDLVSHIKAPRPRVRTPLPSGTDPLIEGTRRYLIVLRRTVTHTPTSSEYKAIIAFGAGVGSGLINVWLLSDVKDAHKAWDALDRLAAVPL